MSFADLSPMETRLWAVMVYLNPRLEEDLEAGPRYAKVINAEVKGNRLPNARKVLAEALRWKP